MVGLPAPSGEAWAGRKGRARQLLWEGPLPNSTGARAGSWSHPARWQEGKETWLAGGPLGSSYSPMSLEIFQHFSSVSTTRGFT